MVLLDFCSESSDFNPTSFSSITFSPFGIVDAETTGSGAGGTTIICEEMSCDFRPDSDNLDLSATTNLSGTQTASWFELFSQVDGLNGTWTIYIHDGSGGGVGTTAWATVLTLPPLLPLHLRPRH